MKKRFLKSALLAVACVGLMANSAMATLVDVTEANGEESLNTIFQNEGWTIDAETDQIGYDSYWSISESESGAWASMIIEVAGNSETNTFGIYDQAGHTLDLMSGLAGEGDKVAIEFSNSGLLSATFKDYNASTGLTTTILIAENMTFSSTFGFYLGTAADTPTFFSDDTLNYAGADHMVAYAGTGVNGLSVGHSILAFEDLKSDVWDGDYNDMVLMVESVQPVPEPATMLLFGTGLAGLAGLRRKKGQKKA